MSISWIGSLVLVLALSLMFIGNNYRLAAEWKKNQIALDNAAIQMGKKDRAILRKIQKVNEHLAQLENRHHELHACSRIPLTALFCKGPDKLIEIQIQLLLRSAEFQAYREWARNGKGRSYQMEREQLIFKKKRCPICWQQVGLEPVSKVLSTRLSLKRSPRNLESGYKVSYGIDSEYQLVGDTGK